MSKTIADLTPEDYRKALEDSSKDQEKILLEAKVKNWRNMSKNLTKLDVIDMINDAFALHEETFHDDQNQTKDFPHYEYWKQNGIKSKLAGLTIAPEDYHEGDKYHFTWDEAMALDLPDGWRLPTRSEWTLICEEFGLGADGELNSNILIKNLNLELRGKRFLEDKDELRNGYFWSSTQCPSYSNNAFNLRFTSSYVIPSNVNSKNIGGAVRCVRKEDEE